MTSAIEACEPVDSLDEVDVGPEPLYAFVDAANDGGATSIEVTFERDGSPAITAGHIELDVPARARRHRTWGFTRGIRAAGRWYAVVRDEEGRELARTPFTAVD